MKKVKANIIRFEPHSKSGFALPVFSYNWNGKTIEQTWSHPILRTPENKLKKHVLYVDSETGEIKKCKTKTKKKRSLTSIIVLVMLALLLAFVNQNYFFYAGLLIPFFMLLIGIKGLLGSVLIAITKKLMHELDGEVIWYDERRHRKDDSQIHYYYYPVISYHYNGEEYHYVSSASENPENIGQKRKVWMNKKGCVYGKDKISGGIGTNLFLIILSLIIIVAEACFLIPFLISEYGLILPQSIMSSIDKLVVFIPELTKNPPDIELQSLLIPIILSIFSLLFGSFAAKKFFEAMKIKKIINNTEPITATLINTNKLGDRNNYMYEYRYCGRTMNYQTVGGNVERQKIQLYVDDKTGKVYTDLDKYPPLIGSFIIFGFLIAVWIVFLFAI